MLSHDKIHGLCRLNFVAARRAQALREHVRAAEHQGVVGHLESSLFAFLQQGVQLTRSCDSRLDALS